MSNSSSHNGLLLPGLDGTNPLGFLAALGVLSCVSQIHGKFAVRMGWVTANATWVPHILFENKVCFKEAHLLDELEQFLVRDRSLHPADLYEKLQIQSNCSKRQFFQNVLNHANLQNRKTVDFLSAIASDITPDDAICQIQTTRRDYHLGNIDSILSQSNREHLRRSLFQTWDYSDPLDNQSLHLDPTEDRRHAYQWNRPSGDPNKKRFGGMLGANRLAIEAISMFTSFPCAEKLATLGFRGVRSDDTFWTWPIWKPPIQIEMIRSILGIRELQADIINSSSRNYLKELGVIAVYRTQRILVEKTPNFTPPMRIA